MHAGSCKVFWIQSLVILAISSYIIREKGAIVFQKRPISETLSAFLNATGFQLFWWHVNIGGVLVE